MNIAIFVNNNGIVHQFEIAEDENSSTATLIQFIVNDKCNMYSPKLNSDTELCKSSIDIKNYRAIYLNGVMVVKNGKVYPRKKIFGIF